MATSPSDSPLVDFKTAMANFKSMFPTLSEDRIETALRKNDGDVATTVDELLGLSNQSSSSTTTFPPNTIQQQSPNRKERRTEPNCENDEKIALMIQNREFLRYLRSDPQFMREINGGMSEGYSPSSSGRRHESVLSRCRKSHGMWRTHEPPMDSARPDAYETQKVPIPNGPIVDPSERPTDRWSKKFQSKLPNRDSAAIPRPEDMYPHTVTVDYPQADEKFVQKLKNMTSQSMFMNLARKFSTSNNRKSKLMPNPYSAGENADFTYELHRNAPTP